MSKRILPLLIVALTLTACAAGGRQTGGPRLIPPAHLTTLPPEQLPEPTSDHLNDLVENHVISAGLYHLARERLKGLVEWIEKTNKELRGDE